MPTLPPIYHSGIGAALAEYVGNARIRLDPPPRLPSTADNPANARLDGYPAELAATALGLGRPSFCIDAACASSLYAMHLACDLLNAKRADLMLAGAVSAADPLFVQLGFSVSGTAGRRA